VFAAIGGQSFVAATGSLGEQSENAYQYSMEYKGTLKTVEEFNDIVLRTSDGGHLLRLSDVAEVEIGAVSYNFTSNIDGKPGTIYMVFQAPGANATEVNARINKLYEELKPSLPSSLSSSWFTSSSRASRQRSFPRCQSSFRYWVPSPMFRWQASRSTY